MPRMTIEFPDKVNDILNKLAEKDQTTKADVLRRALALYNFVHQEAVDKNMKLSVTDKNDKILKDIVFQ